MSTVNVGTFFGAPEVEITGNLKEYVTPGRSGMPFHYFFVLNAELASVGKLRP